MLISNVYNVNLIKYLLPIFYVTAIIVIFLI